ncbi:unnamed protein product [Peronospora belbahrii]|uniref:C2 domain-containing protein n=1 Tax=Peronospora belbahrii TaxID=622444 RepID=A0AAU9KM00_9STRA|nr:unnamed protein product [Peronospora belbahrii]
MTSVTTPRVELVVVGATNVGKTQKGDSKPLVDLYCQVQCGNIVLRTAKTRSPQWMQNFIFGIKQPLGESIKFQVFELSKRRQDILLGTATLFLQSVIPDKKILQKLTLIDGEGTHCGELVVEITYELKYVVPSGIKDTTASSTKPATTTKSSDSVSSTINDLSSSRAVTKETIAVENIDVDLLTVTAAGSLSSAEKAEPVRPPNFYVVTVLEATGLLACDGTGMEATSDPYVRVTCTKNQSQRTKTQQQTLDPSWRQRFYFLIVPGEKQLLELTVEDSDLLTSDFMGRCIVDLDEFTKRFGGEKQTFWLALEQQTETKDKFAPSDLGPQRTMNYGRGKICLAIELQYLDRDISTLEQGEIDNATEVPSSLGLWHQGSSEAVEGDGANNGNGAEDTNEEYKDGGDDDDIGARRKEAEAQWKQREEERQKMLAELSNVQFQSGDYQIRARIIEVRDLQSMDANGLCDPVISVECLGQRQYTVVKQKQLSCVFDEYLYFNFKQLDKETVQQGSIKISVYDADGPGSSAKRSASARAFDDLIGFFSVDIPYVYYQPDHELKRKWVALIGSGATNSDCIQGYVLLSLVVLGPDDKMKLYDPSEDKDPDERLVKSKADINLMVLVPPRVTQKLSFLVITIYRAEELPDMDYSMVMQGGIDGYVRAYFTGQDVLETKKVTMKGSENLAVTFNQELWFPVLLPTMSDNIFLSVWDWDMATTDQLVANILQPFSFKQVQRYPNQFKNVWTNLYGPPVGYSTDSSPLQMMQNHPVYASTYRGRILLSMRVEDGSQSANDDAHVRNLLNTAVLPRMRRYTLRTALFYGTEIPVFKSNTNWNRNARMSLKISIGRHSVESSRAHNLAGVCHFNQYLDIIDVELPADLDQVPDVFVHLVRPTMNESRCICFARFRAQDLFCQDPEALTAIAPPEWVVLHEDKVLDELKDHDFTGNILMNLRLEDSTQKVRKEEKVAQQWRQYASTTVQYMKYVLFIYVFQGKCLPATDIDGLLDPYVKVFVSVRKAKSAHNEKFLPKVSLQVYDWDRYDTDDYVGGLKFSLADFPPISSSDYSKIRASGEYSAPRPKWFPICYEEPGDTQGELLLSFDLIKKDTPGVIVDPPESIRPPAEEVFVEIMCLGCRGLQPTGFMPINTPFAKFEIGEITKTNQPKFTNPSSKPSGRNPNFLQRIVVPVKMPLDSLFAPRLNITVYDQLLGGFYKPVIGVCSVNLSRKMPLRESNAVYSEECNKSIVRGSNPYVDYGDDLSTFPGTIPSKVLKARSLRVLAEKSVPDKSHKLRKAGMFASSSFGICDDDEDELPHYMRQRDVVDGELEDTLQSPFETFTLFRGSMPSRDTMKQSADTYRPVGKFKGIVRILKSRDEPPLFDLDQFLNPRTYLVRVYVLNALNLHPKDVNNRCDPYLRVSLGDGRRREQMYNDRTNYQSETLAPKFHKMYEFKADLPGASELKLEVLDYDFFAIPTIPTGLSKALSTAVGTAMDGDDFVGATGIDLEDRWFDAKWQELGSSTEWTERRKPLEVRPLFTPSSARPQGSLCLWVDILTESEMNVVKPLDISLPPPQMFEVRVIVYKAKNVTAGDFTDLSDLFVKCWFQNHDDKSQSTDIHWRARHGRASFNWRMKFDVELPLDPEKEADRGCLHFQLWDRDVVYDDCLADAMVDLTSFLKAAFKTKQAVNVFAKPKPIRIRGSENMPYKSTSQRLRYSATEGATSVAHLQPPCSNEVVISIADGDGKEADRQPLLSGNLTTDDDDDTEDDDVDADMENAESLVKSFMHRLGMGDDPEDANWLTMTTRDSNTGDRVRAGELLVAVEILPKYLAEVRSAGLGRGEPNNFPFLPEPADRLHLSAMWNPCYVLEALMGSKYYRTFASFFLCTMFTMLVLFAGPLINVLLTLFELIPQPFGFIFFFAVLTLLMATLVYLIYRCRRAIIRYSSGDNKNLSTRTKSRKRKVHRALR